MELRLKHRSFLQSLGGAIDLFGRHRLADIRESKPSRKHRNQVITLESPEEALKHSFEAVGSHIRSAAQEFRRSRSG